MKGCELISSVSPAIADGRDHVFGLVHPKSKREFLFQALSAEDRKDWIDKIVSAGAVLREPVIKDGYLEKCDKNYGKWASRYIVLHSDNIKYYKTKAECDKQEKPKGLIQLTHTAECLEHSHDKKNTISVIANENERSRKYLFIAKNEFEMKEWIEAINVQIRILQTAYKISVMSHEEKIAYIAKSNANDGVFYHVCCVCRCLCVYVCMGLSCQLSVALCAR